MGRRILKGIESHSILTCYKDNSLWRILKGIERTSCFSLIVLGTGNRRILKGIERYLGTVFIGINECLEES